MSYPSLALHLSTGVLYQISPRLQLILQPSYTKVKPSYGSRVWNLLPTSEISFNQSPSLSVPRLRWGVHPIGGCIRPGSWCCRVRGLQLKGTYHILLQPNSHHYPEEMVRTGNGLPTIENSGHCCIRSQFSSFSHNNTSPFWQTINLSWLSKSFQFETMHLEGEHDWQGNLIPPNTALLTSKNNHTWMIMHYPDAHTRTKSLQNRRVNYSSTR